MTPEERKVKMDKALVHHGLVVGPCKHCNGTGRGDTCSDGCCRRECYECTDGHELTEFGEALIYLLRKEFESK